MNFASQEEINQYLSDRINQLSGQIISLNTQIAIVKEVLRQSGAAPNFDYGPVIDDAIATFDQNAESDPIAREVWLAASKHLQISKSIDPSMATTKFSIIPGGKKD